MRLAIKTSGRELLSRRRLWRRVRPEISVVLIRRNEPDVAVVEIGEELGILGGIEFAGPKNLGGIDFCPVVNPLVMQIVVFLVAHHDQVFAWSMRKLSPDGRATGVSLAGPLQLVANVARDREPDIDCEEIKDSPGKREAQRASTETNRAQVADGLDEQQKNHARQRRGIVRHRPDQYQESGRSQE